MSRDVHEQPKLFGEDKYAVEDAARILTEARELETAKPKIFVAALKVLERRQRVIGSILKAKGSKKNG